MRKGKGKGEGKGEKEVDTWNESGKSIIVDVHMLLDDGDELSCLLYTHVNGLQGL